MKIALLIAGALLASFLLPTTQPKAGTVACDGFEAPTLSQDWDISRLVPGAAQIESHTVRAGHSALEVTVRSGEKFEAGIHGDADNERAELTEARRLMSHQDTPYEYRFSMYFPSDFPIVPVRLVVAQWKQACPESGLPCSDDSPVLALRYSDGELRITQNLNHKTTILYREKDELRGRWLDWRFQVRFTSGPGGRIKTWLNNRQVVDYAGPTSNRETADTGYSNPSRFYFKMGLYRDVMKEPMTVYIDEYRKRQLAAGEL